MSISDETLREILDRERLKHSADSPPARVGELVPAVLAEIGRRRYERENGQE